jgi:hypothetical protein
MVAHEPCAMNPTVEATDRFARTDDTNASDDRWFQFQWGRRGDGADKNQNQGSLKDERASDAK